MCGIAGMFCENGEAAVKAEERVLRAREKLCHRGPDDHGLEIIKESGTSLFLAHTRLSILDLSSSGRQPMTSADGHITLVYNGEIFNYKELRSELMGKGYHFRTETDSEVLISAWDCWGEECLPRLTGMFAMTLYDRRTGVLTAARDAFGIKPYYYSQQSGHFCFASEIPALLELSVNRPALNMQSCYNYLMFSQYDQRDETFYEGIHRLQAGHLFNLNLKEENPKPEIRRWWSPSIEEEREISFKEAVEEVREQFLHNIRLHLRSDVPLGAALSGGIDSSAVVCAMRYLYPDMPIHTFSYIAGGSNVNEEKWADLVNGHVKAIPHKVEFQAGELLDDLDDLIRTQGEPFGTTSIYAQYRVFKQVRESGITVTLDGQGADELLAGYDGYPISRFRSLIERGEYGNLLELAKGWKTRHGGTNGQIFRYLRSSLVSDKLRDFSEAAGRKPVRSWIDSDQLRKTGILLNHRVTRKDRSAKGRRLAETLRNELTNETLQALLRHGDRNSMRWSVESRVPFLTASFAEYMLKLPEEYLLSSAGETKSVFREAMRGIVPDAVLDRQDKIGFQTPEKKVIGDLGNHILSGLGPLEELPFIRMDILRREVQKTLDGTAQKPVRLWQIFNLSRFIEQAGIKRQSTIAS